MTPYRLAKIVSGGQTGVDRAALDAARYREIAHGGWCPRGRRAENGRIPARYQLKEMPSRDYAVRTEQNVIDSDGTLILYRDRMSGGTELTWRLAAKHRRPRLAIDLRAGQEPKTANLPPEVHWEYNAARMLESVGQVHDWLVATGIGVLNVAGPRESTSPGIGAEAEAFLVQLLGNRDSDPIG